MKSRIASFLTAAGLWWAIAPAATAQTNDSIQIKAIRLTSEGGMSLDLVLSEDLAFCVEHSTDLVSWQRFPEPPEPTPDKITLVAIRRYPAGPLKLYFPRESVPSGGSRFFRCRVFDLPTAVDPSTLPGGGPVGGR